MEFSNSGILFMIGTWAAILLLNTFCFFKVLTKKEEKK